VVGGAITWKSKKQTIIAMSSTESEYVALSEAGHEAFWLKIFMMNLASHRWDRQSSKATMKVQLFYLTTLNSMCGQNTLKYITIDWVRDLVNDKVLDVQSCCDPEQMADILTKPLPMPKHQRHRQEMGMGAIK